MSHDDRSESQPPQDHTEAETPKDETREKGGNPQPQTPIVSHVRPAPERQTEGQYCKAERTPGWLRFIETVAAFAVIAYAIISYFQWRAFSDSNTINREALESVQRAFISAQVGSGGTIEAGPRHPGITWAFQMLYNNNGTTPALDFLSNFQTSATEPNEATFAVLPQAKSTYTVAPRGTTASGFSLVNEKDVIAKRFQAKPPGFRSTFLWGWATYRDVFPNTSVHLTEYCYWISGIAQNGPSFNFSYAFCGNHNCTDENCKDYDQIVALTTPRTRPTP